MGQFLAIACGGALGACCRYAVARWVQRSSLFAEGPFSGLAGEPFPWGTVMVNLSGCLLIGLAAGLLMRPEVSTSWRAFLLVGFLGSYTTFSTFSYETLALLRAGDTLAAFANGAGAPILGVLGVWLGDIVARALSGS
ncbi:MAG: fluoride efflux transporter CrcB [Acidobacteriota bacterium]